MHSTKSAVLRRVVDAGTRLVPASLRARFRESYLDAIYYELFPELRPFTPADTTGSRSFRRFKRRLAGGTEPDLAGLNTACRPDLVSVVLPTYNQGRYLPGAIESILQQRYENLELIVIDDGSTDDTSAVLERYAADARFRFVRQSNQGVPSALNQGFSRARGEYWTWTSSDNIMPPDQLSIQTQVLRSRPEIQGVFGDMRLIDQGGLPLKTSTVLAEFQSREDTSYVKLPRSAERLNTSAYNFIGARFLYRAWSARVIGKYDESWPLVEDYDFWMRFNTWFRLMHEPHSDSFYQYRIHSASLSAQRTRDISSRTRALVAADAHRRRQYGTAIPACFDGSTPGLAALREEFCRHAYRVDASPVAHRDRPAGVWIVDAGCSRRTPASLDPETSVVVGVAWNDDEALYLDAHLPSSAWVLQVGAPAPVGSRPRQISMPGPSPIPFLVRAIYRSTAPGEATLDSNRAGLG